MSPNVILDKLLVCLVRSIISETLLAAKFLIVISSDVVVVICLISLALRELEAPLIVAVIFPPVLVRATLRIFVIELDAVSSSVTTILIVSPVVVDRVLETV